MTKAKAEVALFSATEKTLAEIKVRFNWTPEKLDAMLAHVDEQEVVKGAKKTCTELRTALTKAHKDVKAPILAEGKRIDNEKKRIEALIRAVEQPLDDAIARRKSKEDADKDAEIARLKAQLAEANGTMEEAGINLQQFEAKELKVTLMTAKQYAALEGLLPKKTIKELRFDEKGTPYVLELVVRRASVDEDAA